MPSSVHQNTSASQAAEQPQDHERARFLQELRKPARYKAWEKLLHEVPNERLDANEKELLTCLLHYNHNAYHITASGFFRITKGTIVARTSLSKPTVGRVLHRLAAIGAVEKLYGLGERKVLKDASYIWIRLPLLLLASPGKIALGRQRNHGGRHSRPHCGSETEKIKSQIALEYKNPRRKSVIIEKETDQRTGNTVETERKKNDASAGFAKSSTINHIAPDTDRAEGHFGGDQVDTHYKPVKIKKEKGDVTAEKIATTRSTADNNTPQEQEEPLETSAVPLHASPQSREEVARLPDQEALERASLVLANLAGPVLQYRHMAESPYRAKYYTEHAPFTVALARLHLEGKATYGVSLSRPDGTTNALCFDGDNREGWDRLKQATKALTAAYYLVLLEKSPASDDHAGGGHLWILFDAPVPIRAALHHVYSLAPALVGLERFPHGNKQVRLPGGIYRYGVNVFCKLASVVDGDVARNGAEAARLLLTHLTPASTVPAFSENELPPEPARKVRTAVPRNPCEEPENALDGQWHAKYGRLHLPFGFSQTWLAWRWCQEHPVETLLEFGSNGLAFSWDRKESVPSVKINPDSTCTDYGRWLEDTGQNWKGDALEVYCDQTHQDKSVVLSAFAKEIDQRARAELRTAAEEGQPIPAWLEKVITADGRAYYEHARRQDHVFFTGFSASGGPPTAQRPKHDVQRVHTVKKTAIGGKRNGQQDMLARIRAAMAVGEQ